jgi:hypothetical protein
MHDLHRRNLLKLLTALSAARALDGRASALYNLAAPGSSSAARFANKYTAYLPEKAVLAAVPKVLSFDATVAKDGKHSAARVGEDTGGWRLLVIARLKGNKRRCSRSTRPIAARSPT